MHNTGVQGPKFGRLTFSSTATKNKRFPLYSPDWLGRCKLLIYGCDQMNRLYISSVATYSISFGVNIENLQA
jgi:hypothetical protein